MQQVKVWGDIACFSRVEMHTERVSYPVMTPSAARGVLEAIFWKPEFTWQVREIWVLNPIKWISIMRNEVKSKASISAAQKWATSGGAYYADEDRTQRHTLALRDVSYIILAEIVMQPDARDPAPKYIDMFQRRVARGQCMQQPYLGIREYVAYFQAPSKEEPTIALTTDLGRMLHSIEYDTEGRGTPHFFHATIEAGVLYVPPMSHDGWGLKRPHAA
jgi:CRISPR-associated protein Cas5d